MELQQQLQSIFVDSKDRLARHKEFRDVYGLDALTWEHFRWGYTVFDMFAVDISKLPQDAAHHVILPFPSAVFAQSQALQVKLEQVTGGGVRVVVRSKLQLIQRGALLTLRELEAIWNNEDLVLRVGRAKPSRECIYQLELDIPEQVLEDEIRAFIYQFKQLSERHYIYMGRKPDKLLDTLRLCCMNDGEIQAFWQKLNADDDDDVEESVMRDEEDTGDTSLALHTSNEESVIQTARALIQSVVDALSEGMTETPSKAMAVDSSSCHSDIVADALCRQYWQCAMDILEDILHML